MKTVDDYLSLNYRKVVYQDEDGDFIVEVPDLPGCMADGRDPNEALQNARDAMASWIRSRMAAKLPVPEPSDVDEVSGRVLLRMPRFLHRRLAQQASQQQASLNQLMVSMLSDASARLDQNRTAAAASVHFAEPMIFRGPHVLNREGLCNIPDPAALQCGAVLSPTLNGWRMVSRGPESPEMLISNAAVLQYRAMCNIASDPEEKSEIRTSQPMA